MLRRSISVSSEKRLKDIFTFQMSLRETGKTLPASYGLTRDDLGQKLRRRDLTDDITDF